MAPRRSLDRPLDPTDPLVDRVLRTLDLLAERPGPLGVAVSGGSDSTALLLLATLWGAQRRRSVLAATVDHGLRPEAVIEAHAVAGLCEHLGVRHATLTWRPEGPMDQARSRNVRHTQLAHWARGAGASTIALGHTADDRIETMLLRVRAGSHAYGLASPLPSSPSPVWPEGRGIRLIRPLLAICRDDLRNLLTGAGQSWIEDPSNISPKHERVRIRQRIAALPEAARHSALHSADGLARLRQQVMADARAALADGVESTPDALVLAGDAFARTSQEARLRLLEALLLATGGASVPPRRDRLLALERDLSAVDTAFRRRTLAGVDIARTPAGIVLRPARPRRGDPRPPIRAEVERAVALLADPGLEAVGLWSNCDPGANMRSFVTGA